MKKIDILDQMWARHLYGWSQKENDQFWDEYYELIMENVKPKEDASSVMKELFQKHEIFIITARWDKTNGIIEQITKQWLEKYGFSYHHLMMGKNDKKKVVQEYQIDLMIDDSYKVCQEIAGIKIKAMLMNTRLNQRYQDLQEEIQRVYSWKEIKEKLQI